MKTINKFKTETLIFAILLLVSCNNNSHRQDKEETNPTLSIINTENIQQGTDFNWELLTYSDGTYGAKVNGQTVLSECTEKIYSEGYNGSYIFQTQKGRDIYVYDINGSALFNIENIDYLDIHPFMSKNTMKNGYILVKDFNDNAGVYDLKGNVIIEPQFLSFEPIYSKLGNDENAIWGFKCDKRNDKNYYIYDWSGNFIFAGESLFQKSNGVLPTFQAENNGTTGLFNHKGERIINIDDYYDYYPEVTSSGMTYIILKTYEDIDEYRESDDMEWIDIYGNTIKPLEGRRNNSLWNENNEIVQREKKKLRENMQANKVYVTHKNVQHIDQQNYTNNYNTNTDYNNQNSTIEQSYIEEDNSRWEQHYKSTYARYEKNIIEHINTLNTLQTTGNGSATSTYAISDTKARIRNTQSEMQRVRNEAQQHNIYISPSSWESANY